MSMMLLDTDNTWLAILDLLSPDKRALLARTDSGPRAIPRLETIAERLASVVHRGKPYTEQLAHADRIHDVGCAVLNHLCDAHEALGLLPQFGAHGERARRVRAALSMERALTRAGYAEAAANAVRNRRAIDRVRDDLRAMPAAAGVTAEEVAELFIAGGEEIREWLGRRADAMAHASAARAEAGPNVLHEAREVLSRLRATLEGEVSWRDDLPSDLVGRIFSVLDERIAAAAATLRSGRAAGAGQDGSAVVEPSADDGAGVDATAVAAEPAEDDAAG